MILQVKMWQMALIYLKFNKNMAKEKDELTKLKVQKEKLEDRIG